MPTSLSHSIVGLAAGKIFQISKKRRFWVLSFLCPSLPDLDLIGWYLGVAYLDVLGHRGITHSLFFACLVGVFVSLVFFRKENLSIKKYLLLIVYFSCITMTHSFVDALTNGGEGIAFFAPFNESRYFFPITPIQVAPLDPKLFFGQWGLDVLISELIWICIPVTALLAIKSIIHKLDISKR